MPLCQCLRSLCNLSGCLGEHPENETGSPAQRTSHTADHPLPELNCAPSSQSLGWWSGWRRHILCLSYSPLSVPWEVGALQLPRHPPPSRPSQRSRYLSAGCRTPAGFGLRSASQHCHPLVFASPDPDRPHWCRNGNMSGTLQVVDVRRLCRFRPGDHRRLPDNSRVYGAFQQSLGFCKERERHPEGDSNGKRNIWLAFKVLN